MMPLYKTISPSVEAALGAVLRQERKRIDMTPRGIAVRADFKESAVRDFECGKRQPNLAAFITLAWSFDEDPRELLDKVLLRMRLPPGSRPVLTNRP